MRRTNTCDPRPISASAHRHHHRLSGDVSRVSRVEQKWEPTWRLCRMILAALVWKYIRRISNNFTGLGRCCGRAWLLPDRQLLFILKSWFNDAISFLFDTVRVPVFHLSKNRTENWFHVLVRAINPVPVHKTRRQGSCLDGTDRV